MHFGKQSVSRPSSTAVIHSLDGGRELQADFVACCHCGRHHLVTLENLETHQRGGKKIEFGFCARCNHPTCPSEPCASTCTPNEQQIENMESGRPRLHYPTRVAFPRTLKADVEHL